MADTPVSDTVPIDLDQLRAVRVIRRAIESNRLAQAILLHGENLRVLEVTARSLAADILDSDRDQVVHHPDLFILRTRGKARQITIGAESERSGGDWPPNSMRRFIHDLNLTPQAGNRKVGLVIEADRMNRSTANAFLKTLEEPPSDTTLFLLTVRPYDLLDTIRSRCLNFSLQAAMETIDEPSWTAWKSDYQAWLGDLAAGLSDRSDVARITLGVYGFICRFESVLSILSDVAWEAHREELPDTIGDDEKAAIETGIRKSIRQQMFGDIERATRDFGIGATDAASVHPRRLARAVELLEHQTVLVDKLNLNPATALEAFLLGSLRIWVNRD